MISSVLYIYIYIPTILNHMQSPLSEAVLPLLVEVQVKCLGPIVTDSLSEPLSSSATTATTTTTIARKVVVKSVQ